MQDAEEDVGHLGVAVAPVMAVLQPHIRAASDKRGQVLRQVCGAGAGTVEHDGVIEHRAAVILIALQTLKEMHELLGEKLVVLSELQLTVLVLRVRQAVVGALDAELNGERIADAHAVLPIEHEGDAACDVRIERQRDEVEHRAIVISGITLGIGVELEVRMVLFLQWNIDPFLGRDQTFLHFIERGEVLIHLFAIGFSKLSVQ